MKLKTYKIWLVISAIVWAVFTGWAWIKGLDLGTIATLGGIALMFAWMWEEKSIKG